jgi:hypothetical protein
MVTELNRITTGIPFISKRLQLSLLARPHCIACKRMKRRQAAEPNKFMSGKNAHTRIVQKCNCGRCFFAVAAASVAALCVVQVLRDVFNIGRESDGDRASGVCNCGRSNESAPSVPSTLVPATPAVSAHEAVAVDAAPPVVNVLASVVSAALK